MHYLDTIAWNRLIFVVFLAGTLAYAQGSASKDPADSEDGELVSAGENPVVRFGVWRLKTSWSQETGYLYFSNDRIRYEAARPKGSQGFDRPRSDLRSAVLGKCCLGNWPVVRFDFGDQGNWAFAHVTRKKVEHGRLGANRSEEFLNQSSLVKAATSFDALFSILKSEAHSDPATQPLQPRLEEQAGATLILSTQPGNVEVYFDDVFEGPTDVEGKKTLNHLRPGSHRLRLDANGYGELTREVVLSIAEKTRVEIKLDVAGPAPLTNDDVEELLRSGAARSHIIQFVNRYGVNFSLSEKSEERLRSLGADDAILLAIAKAKK